MTEQAARFACAKGFKKHEYEGKFDTLLAVLRALMIGNNFGNISQKCMKIRGFTKIVSQ